MKSSEEMLRLLKEQEKSIKEADSKIAYDDDIKLSPRIDVEMLLRNGYISADNYRKNHCRTIDESQYVTLDKIMERTAFIEDGKDNKSLGNEKEEITTLIELIKCVEKIQFTEQREGDGVIGYINNYNRIIQVSFLKDNLGQYLKLSYPIKSNDENIKKSIPYLSRWFVNGRHMIEGDTIVVFSVLPIIDEAFLSKQITHALSEIWDMNNVVNSTCK